MKVPDNPETQQQLMAILVMRDIELVRQRPAARDELGSAARCEGK